MRGEGPLVGGTRFAAGEISGEVLTASDYPQPQPPEEREWVDAVLVVSPTAFNAATKLPLILPITSGGEFARRIGFAARIAERHFHDLRGTAATRLYLARLTPREIAQTLGWAEDRVERMIDVYVKRDELMRDLIRRLDAPRSA